LPKGGCRGAHRGAPRADTWVCPYGMIVRLVSAPAIGSFCYVFESKLVVSAKT
jgi:hypothetical protein